MPIIGLGLHLLIALYFGIHAIRSGQNMYWLLILFSFPLLGSIVYFFSIYLPDSRLQYGAKKAMAAAAKVLDPSKELRDARSAFDYTPTARNQMRLAEALRRAGQAEEAAANYETCLAGQFADNAEMRMGAAQAHVESGNFARAIELLELIRQTTPEFRAEQISLLLAQSFFQTGRRQDAKAEFESAITRFGDFEVKAECLIWALVADEKDMAARLQAEVQRITDHWSRQTRDLNRPMLRRLEAAYEHAREKAQQA